MGGKTGKEGKEGKGGGSRGLSQAKYFEVLFSPNIIYKGPGEESESLVNSVLEGDRVRDRQTDR